MASLYAGPAGPNAGDESARPGDESIDGEFSVGTLSQIEGAQERPFFIDLALLFDVL